MPPKVAVSAVLSDDEQGAILGRFVCQKPHRRDGLEKAMRLKRTVTALGAKFAPDHIVLALTLVDSFEAVLGAHDPPHRPSASSTDAAPRLDPLALIDAAALEADSPRPDCTGSSCCGGCGGDSRCGACRGAGRR